MSSVRTVTTVQTSGGHSGQGDPNLDALLQDLQTSVLRGQPATVALNGGGTAKTKIYREETRTVKHVTKPGGYQQQVEYLAPANTTTVVAERAPSPLPDLTLQGATQPGVSSYKTVSYETYNSAGGKTSSHRTVAVDDAGLRKNLTELDSLLVDLHHAQRAGFGEQGSRGRSRSRDAVPISRGGVDPGLLEALDSPPPPPREQVSRSVERTYQTYNTSGPPQRYLQQPPEPKRSNSVNRELIFNESTRSESREQQRSTRSPSPLRQPESPQVPRRNVHKEVYYEKTSTGGSTRQGRATSSPQHQERYRDKSPSNQRLHREVYGYDTRTTSVPASPRLDSGRHVEVSPPPHRRHASPSPQRSSVQRTYNTSSYSSSRDQSATTSPRPYRSPSPIANRSPYVENAPIVELPRRSPSPGLAYQGDRPTKVTTTVRTYTYELPPGQTGYPPGHGGYPGHDGPHDFTDKPLTYQVSPATREPEPTVITYKYSSHNVNKYQTADNPDDRPRPFPTPSPTPGQNGEPPKKLDDLMASFGDAELLQQRKQPPGYFTSERQTSETRTTHSSAEPNGVAVVAPSNVKPPPPPPIAAPTNGSVRNRGNSKNVAGPPVYYPPGVELFAQKEQEARMTSTRAQGEWEKEREKESKGSSGGAGVVPVCLPVCCAMPCSIM